MSRSGLYCACRAALIVFAASVPAPAIASAAGWPGGARAAVVLTYDDALPSQLANAVPDLDARGLKGVFFLSNVQADATPAWRAVAEGGHELANHTIFHPCLAETFPADPRYTLEAYTPDTLIREIERHNALLAALDGRAEHGFALPCDQTVAGGVDYLGPLGESGVVAYSRGGVTDLADWWPAPDQINRMRIPGRGFIEISTAEDLIAYVQDAIDRGSMAVFVFHGVGGDYLSVDHDAHRTLLAWLSDNRDQVWTTTFTELFAHLDEGTTTPR
ncbi:polysaccharide deacetylase family protein [Brevundimonas sp.]|uniref:polysaccharide deacetylase family protein n=1 Tax=Brevundimonas sp. TaxID=1871086 RepID=UPI00391D1A42